MRKFCKDGKEIRSRFLRLELPFILLVKALSSSELPLRRSQSLRALPLRLPNFGGGSEKLPATGPSFPVEVFLFSISKRKHSSNVLGSRRRTANRRK